MLNPLLQPRFNLYIIHNNRNGVNAAPRHYFFNSLTFSNPIDQKVQSLVKSVLVFSEQNVSVVSQKQAEAAFEKNSFSIVEVGHIFEAVWTIFNECINICTNNMLKLPNQIFSLRQNIRNQSQHQYACIRNQNWIALKESFMLILFNNLV